MRAWSFLLLLWATKLLADATPARTYFVPELLPTLVPLHKQQLGQIKSITLQSSTGTAVFISSIDYVKDNRVIRVTDFQTRRTLEVAISQAMKGSLPKELSFENETLFFNGTPLHLTFSTRSLGGTPTEMADQTSWRKEFNRQLAIALFSPRLEQLNQIGETTLLFGFLVDGASVEDEATEDRMAALLKAVLAGQDPSPSLSLNEQNQLQYQDGGEKKTIQIIFYASRNGETALLSASDQQQMKIRLTRHLGEVFVRRPQHRANLTAPPLQTLSPPSPPAARAIPVERETTLKEFLQQKKLAPWDKLLAFLNGQAAASLGPTLAKKIVSESETIKIRFEPIDTFSQPEKKFDTRERILTTEIITNTHQTLSIANNSFATYNAADQSYVLLYGLLKGIDGISDKGAFEFVTKLRMVVQYEEQKSIDPNELKSMIYAMLQSDELADSDRWLTEIRVLKARYEQARRTQSGEARKTFMQSLEESERALSELRAKKQREVFEKVFGIGT